MTTLADINQTLTVQNALQLETRNRVSELGGSFNKFFKMITDASGDDLEKQAEEQRQAAQVKDQTQRTEVKSSGGFFDFDVGNLLPFASGLMGALLKRGLPAALGVILADEVGKFIGDLTGSKLFANVAEWGTIGGAAGFLLGGPMGGLMGAAIGAIFSDASRTKIAEILSSIFDKEIKATDTETLVAAGIGSAMVLLIPTIFKKMLPLILSPTGLLVLGVAAITGAAIKYFTDDDFRKGVDKYLDPLREKIDELFTGILDSATNYIDELFPDLVTTKAEKKKIDKKLSETDAGRDMLAKQEAAEKDLAQFETDQASLQKAGAGGSFEKRIKQLREWAENQGFNLDELKASSGIKLSSIEDPFTLFNELNQILLKRRDSAKEVLEPIEQERKAIERQLSYESGLDGASEADINTKIKATEAQLKMAQRPNEKKIYEDRLEVLKKQKLNLSKATPSLPASDISAATRAAQPPGIGPPPIIDASSKTTNIGGGTTYAGETRPSTLNERVYGTGFVDAVP